MAGDRLSIVTDEVSQDLLECRGFLDEVGLRGVEVRGVGGRRVPDLAPSDVQALTSWRSDGIRINALSPGIFKGAIDDVERADRELADTLPRTLDLAASLGVEQVIAFSFEDPSRRGLARAADALARAAATCAAAGVRLLIENEPGFCASTGPELEALLESAGDPSLFVNWDPANSTDRSETGLRDAVERLGARIRNVHVKNGRGRVEDLLLDYGPLADGEVDWPAHLRALDAIGYEGPLALETHFPPLRESSRQLVSELRAMIAESRPGEAR
ncbi:MAG: hypothetical protein CMJ83_09530 [Planctomycetes bacterium]|nr:hypothetical protein [Planctomycetota bacterium]